MANGLDGALCDLACLLHDIFVAPLNIQEDASTLAWICDRLAITVMEGGQTDIFVIPADGDAGVVESSIVSELTDLFPEFGIDETSR